MVRYCDFPAPSLGPQARSYFLVGRVTKLVFTRRVVKRADAAHCDARRPVIDFLCGSRSAFYVLLGEKCRPARVTRLGVSAFDDTPEREMAM